jgi:hypothetical protein
MWMESQYRTKGDYSCIECGHLMSDKNYAISRHLKKHGMTLYEYVNKNYKMVFGEFSTCGFCDRIAIPSYEINHKYKEFSIHYDGGFFCRSIECKKNISLSILNSEYNPKTFEKIGSRADYLCKLHKIDILEAKNLKYKEPIKKFKGSLEEYQEKYGEIDGEIRYKKRIDGIKKNNPKNKFPCTLENFIKRYGTEIGSKKYKERCERISYTSSKEFFIDKYGEEEGNKAWKNKFKLVKVSKKSKIISDILTKLKYSFETEKEISGKFLDFYLSDINVGIEYFGDYWHLNPKRYESSFYNSQLKMRAFDVWEKDRCRLNVIKESVDSIIVIWESSEVNETLLEKTIKELKNKKTIIYL